MSLKSKAHGLSFYPRINICAFADSGLDIRLVDAVARGGQ